MNVKIDTKEKFTVITPQDEAWSENMADELNDLLLPYLQKDIPHVILNLGLLLKIDEVMGHKLAFLQQLFYEHNNSFVICGLKKEVEDELDKQELLELLNATPTESEAWDIVQMEEIEREILGGDE